MSERSKANDRVAFEISLCIHIYMYFCTLGMFMSRALVTSRALCQLASLALCRIGQVRLLQ